MVNWFYIGLSVTGRIDEVARFREAVRGQNENGNKIEIDFNRVMPIPSELTGPDAYDWCIRNWGAASNACFVEIIEERPGFFWVQFDTALDFPYPVVEKMVAAFPELNFEGSAFDNEQQFYMTFEGRNGQFEGKEGDYKEAFGEEDDDDCTPLAIPEEIVGDFVKIGSFRR